MKITKKEVGEKIMDYLNQRMDLQELVDWAENTVREEEYDEQDFELIREMVARIGLADVKQFGLSWDDCYNYLSQLGYKVKVVASAS